MQGYQPHLGKVSDSSGGKGTSEQDTDVIHESRVSDLVSCWELRSVFLPLTPWLSYIQSRSRVYMSVPVTWPVSFLGVREGRSPG